MRNSFRGREYQKYLLNIMALYKQRPDLKAYLELLLSIATIGVFVIFAIKPTLVTIADLIIKINTLQQTSDAMDTKIKNLGIAQTLYNANGDKITLLNEQAVPANPNVAAYVRQTEGLTKKNNISTVSVSVDTSPLVAATGSGTINVTETLTGAYGDLASFLKDVELLRRPTFIDKLDIVSFNSGQGTTLNLTTQSEVPYN